MDVDVHQHLWGEPFVAALRERDRPPRLDGWTLHLPGEPPSEIDPADHDPVRRAELAGADGLDRVLIGLSSPLGIEWLPPGEAYPLLDAYHDGAKESARSAADSTGSATGSAGPAAGPAGPTAGSAGPTAGSAAGPAPPAAGPADGSGGGSGGGSGSGSLGSGGLFGAWAAACLTAVDAARAGKDLDSGFAGLQLPATALLDAAGYARCAPLLDLLVERDLPLFVHPGAAPPAGSAPGWWAALVPYVQQMHAAWFAFRAHGRQRHPGLRVCFALLAGLGPLHAERLAARGGGRGEVDPLVFVETSSYGPRAVDAVTRALGVDQIVLGSDRPYAAPPAGFGLGAAAEHALRAANPRRLLGPGGRPAGTDHSADSRRE